MGHARNELVWNSFIDIILSESYKLTNGFWARQPYEPAVWLALLLTKVGDVEADPGPTHISFNASLIIKNTCSSYPGFE